MKSKLFLILRVAISLALIAVLIHITRDSIPKMFAALKGMPLRIFLLGFLMFLSAAVIVSLRLKILLATQGIPLNVADVIRLTFMGYFFSSFLPTAVGGDVVKAFYISKASQQAMRSYTSVFMDRLLGMCSIFLIATCALFFAKNIPGLYFKWLLHLLLIAGILFLMFLFNKEAARMLSVLFAPVIPEKLKEKFKNLYDTLHDYTKYRREMAVCLLISMAGQTMAFSAIYVFGVGLESHLPLKLVLLAMPISAVAGLIPSLYGTGPREMAMVMILSPFIGKEKALAIAFLWLGVLLLAALIGGIAYLVTGWHKIKLDDLSDYNLKMVASEGGP